MKQKLLTAIGASKKATIVRESLCLSIFFNFYLRKKQRVVY